MMGVMGDYFATVAATITIFVLVIDPLLLKKDLKSKELSPKLMSLFMTII